VLELAAMRWGIAAPRYFSETSSPRLPHSERHLDLCEFLTNFGEIGLRGGMDLLLKLIGLPGKVAMNGAMVQEYFDSGRIAEIHRYCRMDVIQTYFLFLRVAVLRGRLDQPSYQSALSSSSAFLEELEAQPAAIRVAG
jgi:predicted PolB exonuclease-like 3'-5' exonuclease